MKYIIVSGSTRKDSNSLKTSLYIKDLLASINQLSEVEIIDLSIANIPQWDESFWTEGNSWSDIWNYYSQILHSCNALIIVTPEWGGMVPPELKNIFLLATNSELAHKPALIISISSGTNGGSYPVAELRMSSYKNTKICYLPEHVIIKNVSQFLTNEHQYQLEVHNRIQHSLNTLKLYAQQFKSIREQIGDDIKLFKYGM